MNIWEFTNFSKEDLEKIKEHYAAIEKLICLDMMDKNMRRELNAELKRREDEEE